MVGDPKSAFYVGRCLQLSPPDNFFTYYFISLAFFVHASVAVLLRQQDVNGDDSHEWTSYLSNLAVQIPMAVVGNALMVAQMHILYDIRAHHGYMFVCLLLESAYGIHFGKQLGYVTTTGNAEVL